MGDDVKKWAPGCSPRAWWAKQCLETWAQSCVPGTCVPTNPTMDFLAPFSPVSIFSVPVFPGRFPQLLSAAESLLRVAGCC